VYKTVAAKAAPTVLKAFASDSVAAKAAPTVLKAFASDSVAAEAAPTVITTTEADRTGQMGRTVVCLMSERTMLEFTSWIPGSCDSFSKKNRSYALMSSVTIRSKKSTLPSTT